MMVGNVSELRKDLISFYHDSPNGGHSDITSTLQRLKQEFYWKKMKQDVIWKDISMHFIEGLPKAAGKEAIFVVVDRLSKSAHFMALKHPYSPLDVAQLLMDGVFKLHGMPETVVSYRGDWVHIKLQLYRQLSLKSHNFQKLSAKFFGPFQILVRVGAVAYTLNLLKDSKIHPTFHVSQLKKKLESHTIVVTLPIVHLEAGHVLMVPEAIIDRRLIKKNVKLESQLLVKWLHAAEEDCT
ncbi:uncharacterized protein [Nicotiana tomentosiformis]|uniref:uncharacterized protein n=1 Tax=Nicotiana tomentosiformis TaxID=4098 RepID=UPI00388CA309